MEGKDDREHARILALYEGLKTMGVELSYKEAITIKREALNSADSFLSLVDYISSREKVLQWIDDTIMSGYSFKMGTVIGIGKTKAAADWMWHMSEKTGMSIDRVILASYLLFTYCPEHKGELLIDCPCGRDA